MASTVLHTYRQNAFNSGIHSPAALGRTGTRQSDFSSSDILNMLPIVEGPSYSRPGTEYLGEALANSRMVAFALDLDRNYILEFSPLSLRIWTKGSNGFGLIPDPSNSAAYLTITTTYTEDHLKDLAWSNLNDFLFLCTSNHQPMVLKHFGPTQWILEPMNLIMGPYKPRTSDLTVGQHLKIENFNRATTGGHLVKKWVLSNPGSWHTPGGHWVNVRVPIVPSETYGVLHAKLDAAYLDSFTSAPSEALNEYGQLNAKGKQVIENRGYIGKETSVNKEALYYHQILTSNFDFFKPTDVGRWVRMRRPIPKVKKDRVKAEDADEDVFKYFHAQIYTVPNARKAHVITHSDKPIGTVDKIVAVELSLFSFSTGWPSKIAIHKGRLFFSGYDLEPTILVGSKAGDFTNFAPGPNDDEGLFIYMATGRMDKVQWLVGLNHLLVGTSSTEASISAASDGPLTPSNISVQIKTRYGSGMSSYIQDGDVFIFADRSRKILRTFRYLFEKDSYSAPALTLLASHLFADSTIRDIAYSSSPQGSVWVCLEDGTFLGCLHDSEQKVTAWHRHDLSGGKVRQIVVGKNKAEYDHLFLIVERMIEGEKTFNMERFRPYDFPGSDVKKARYLDSHLPFKLGSPSMVLTGLTHLKGQMVTVFSNGILHYEGAVDSDGRLMMSAAVQEGIVGLPYRYMLVKETVTPASTDIVGLVKQIVKAQIRYVDSVEAGLYYDDKLQNKVFYRRLSQYFGQEISLITGITEHDVLSGQSPNISLRFEGRSPFPLNIASFRLFYDLPSSEAPQR